MGSFECTIDDFLRGIPDPVAEFNSDFYVRFGYGENAEIYLQYRYPNLSPETIKEKLMINNYNLLAVCEQFENEGYEPGLYNINEIKLHHSASVYFHQEVWYIEHKAEIQNYFDSVIQAAKIEEELNRPPTPPPVDEVFECGICCNEVVEYAELGTCDGLEGHLYCRECIKRHVEVQFHEGSTTFSCLGEKCEGFIPLQTVKEVLPPNLFAILSDKIYEADIKAANIPGIETCPFCSYAYGPGDDSLFICLNPICMKQSCRICRKEEHSPDLCEMFKNENEETARHFIENKMTEALVRQCHSCGKEFVKEPGGCNKMVCKCGAIMCYLCRQPVKDYSHFNGQGGSNFNRCELFSTEATVHEQPVEVSAQEALNQLIANNPGINLDPNKVIPK